MTFYVMILYRIRAHAQQKTPPTLLLHVTSVQVIFIVDTLVTYYCVYYKYYLNIRYTSYNMFDLMGFVSK